MSDPLFTVRVTDWDRDGKALQSVRIPVFVIEQQVAAEEEFDAVDLTCVHFLALDKDGAAIGTGRIDDRGKIGRMAVVLEWRKHGVGKAILQQALDHARRVGLKRVYLHAQTSALGFYERNGFIGFGDRFVEAGIEHLAMELRL